MPRSFQYAWSPNLIGWFITINLKIPLLDLFIKENAGVEQNEHPQYLITGRLLVAGHIQKSNLCHHQQKNYETNKKRNPPECHNYFSFDNFLYSESVISTIPATGLYSASLLIVTRIHLFIHFTPGQVAQCSCPSSS